jgi:hypothetical protein
VARWSRLRSPPERSLTLFCWSGPLLGHKDLSTTALYTKVDTRGRAEMPRPCHPREKS